MRVFFVMDFVVFHGACGEVLSFFLQGFYRAARTRIGIWGCVAFQRELIWMTRELSQFRALLFHGSGCRVFGCSV